MPEQEIELLIETFRRNIDAHDDRALRLIDLAGLVARRKFPLRAVELCREAIAMAGGTREIEHRARRLLSMLVDGYHVPVLNDPRRSAAWEQALRRAVRPGARVLEIGTGAGLLAMMAARAGAGKVISCERNAVMAAIAREIIALNGYSNRVDVVAKPSHDLELGIDLDGPAELLFCDIFANDMLAWEPLRVLADARRLLVQDYRVIPACGAIRIALADWRSYESLCRLDRPSGFDLSPFDSFVPPAVGVEIGDPGLAILSHEAEVFRFDFGHPSEAAWGRNEFVLEATEKGAVSGVAAWTRLELVDDIVLEARPEPGTQFYQSLLFFPFAQRVAVERGTKLGIGAAHDAKRLLLWPIGR